MSIEPKQQQSGQGPGATTPDITPDPATVINLINAFRGSKAMFAAVALGVFDRLEEAARDARILADELGLDPGPLERLLDACTGLGLLHKQNGIYRCAPVSLTYLCRRNPRTLAGYVLYSNNMLYSLWGHLEDAVRQGTPRWQQTFGVDAPIFQHFFRTPDSKREFLAGMHGFGLLSSPPVVAAFDLERFTRLVDLGGGTGHLAMAACERFPHLHATVFDLPAALEVAQDFVRDSPFSHRIGFVAGDFFTDALPEADLYALGRILHDWSEDKIDRLLDRIITRLPSGGALLIAECILDADKTGPLPALLQSLNMLVATEGRERTFDEYKELLRGAGFAHVEAHKTGAPLDAILALKA